MSAASSGTFALGGDLPVARLGFGAMRITGDGVWGPRADPAADDGAVAAALAGPVERLGAAPGHFALAWMLRRSPVMLPIPGTGRVAHLEENVAAAELTLTDEEVAALDAATPSGSGLGRDA